jgi:GxxExxY protein
MTSPDDAIWHNRYTKDDDPETYVIIGAGLDVHGTLGHGFLESIYHEALLIEFTLRNIPYRHEVLLPVLYKGHVLNGVFRADFICFDQIILEIKAQANLTGQDEAQLLNYMKATGCSRGLLFNFGSARFQLRRRVL